MALNIPQYPGWMWSSPMRILYGLALGRLTVAPRFDTQSAIDAFTITAEQLTVDCLQDIVHSNTPHRTRERIEAYQSFAEDQLCRSDIGDVLREWALVEGLA
jgi:hypothetical protein